MGAKRRLMNTGRGHVPRATLDAFGDFPKVSWWELKYREEQDRQERQRKRAKRNQEAA